MAKIQTVDYEKMPQQAQQMRLKGEALNKEVNDAYNSIKNMHSVWYGKRYNELVKKFNKMIPDLNSLLELVVGEIPYTLETVASNYKKVDTGSGSKASKTKPKKVTNIGESKDVGLKFITSDVTSVKQKVMKNFKNAESKMNEIEAEYKKITWKSEAADAFKSKFTVLKKKIVSSFQEINKSFDTLMKEALNDVQAAEKANTVN